MKSLRRFQIHWFCFFIIFYSCSEISKDGIQIPDKPFENLSEYQFFEGELSALQPAENVLPYELITPLFSDYSHKSRFVWMPEGTSATYTTDHVLDFPKGAVLIKNFYYVNDESIEDSDRRIIETRLLINRGDEWDAYGYTWNDEQTEAHYNIIGDIKEIKWVDAAGKEQKVDYIIPNKNQCKTCHAYDKIQKPIGPKVRNLNKDFTYQSGTSNQLDKWSEHGFLSAYDPEADHPIVADWADHSSNKLHEKSLAYLDINCGHCHNPKGSGNTSGLTLLADSDLGIQLGVFKPTVSAGAGTGGHTYSIVPGNPEESIMVYRMSSNNPGAMMPEVGRRLVHTEGVQLISDWIASLDPNDFEIPTNESMN